MSFKRIHGAALIMAGMAIMSAFGGCGKKSFEYDKDLITNGSFEDVGSDGIPAGWTLVPFRGEEGQSVVRYGIDEKTAQDGTKSFFFEADPGTQRFFTLSQEVEIPEDATHVHLKGWMQIQDAQLQVGQYAQCNFLLLFFNHDHQRFQEVRIADKRTRLRSGSQLWSEEDNTFRVPNGTRYVEVQCILGMNGRVWFDNVSLSVPKPIKWETATTPNFVFHWLPGHPMPAGSQESQQGIFDAVTHKLDMPSDIVINYYFYPDTTTIRRILSLKGYQYVSWDDREFHSINPNDDHEVIHFITDPVGRPPRAIAEGTVFWLHNRCLGMPLDDAVAAVVNANALPAVEHLVDYNSWAQMDPRIALPAAGSFVWFIVDRFGPKKLMELYSAANGVNAYDPFATAFEKTFGVSLADFEAAWHQRLASRYHKG